MLTPHHRSIFNGERIENPVLQCVQIKPLQGATGTVERFRVVFSDIRNFIQSMLATREWRVETGRTVLVD